LEKNQQSKAAAFVSGWMRTVQARDPSSSREIRKRFRISGQVAIILKRLTFIVIWSNDVVQTSQSTVLAASQGFNYDGLLPAHQERLRQLAGHIHSIGCQQTEAAVKIGKMLIEAKGGLQHGRFGQWCAREAGYRPRKAQLLMNLTIFAIKEPDVLHIPVTAGYMLAAPAAPPHIVAKVLSRARDGERVTVAWVEDLFDGENAKEPGPERSNTSEVTKIARLLANAVGRSQAIALRKLLDAAGQSQLRDKLHDTDPAASFNHAVHQPAVGL
jgi:hypothetical protein